MSNVHATTSDLLSRLPKLNYLVVSSGVLTLAARSETSEGIDKKLALHYYSRFAFTHDLLPLLKNAESRGEDAKAYSVYSPTHGGKVDLDDLGLKKSFTLKRAAEQAISYMDIAYKVFCLPSLTCIYFTKFTVRNFQREILPTASLSHMHTPVVLTLAY
jgi:hypothetical protein